MSSTIKALPRFRVGEWVSFMFGVRKLLAQITEYRGPLGRHGDPLYEVQIDRSEPEPWTTQVPEEELEPAPQAPLLSAVARELGFATQNWPRQAIHFTYVRDGKTNHWSAFMRRGRKLHGIESSGAEEYKKPPTSYTTVERDSDPVDAPGDAHVMVLLEYDPRLSDPPVMWSTT
jgi:hypothetical protein